ncbi:hypothetical protein D3C72_1821190 [compost metagenome]
MIIGLLVQGRGRRQRHLGGRRRHGGRGHGRLGRRLSRRRSTLALGRSGGLAGLRHQSLGRDSLGAGACQLVHHRRGQGTADIGLLHQLFDHLVGDDDPAPLVIGRLGRDRLALDLLGQRLGLGLPVSRHLITVGGLGGAGATDTERILGDGIGQGRPLRGSLGAILARLIKEGQVTQGQQTGGDQSQHLYLIHI